MVPEFLSDRVKQGEDKPWDHPYDSDEFNRCIHCGLIGSYAHTEEYYRKWVWGVDPITTIYTANDPSASWNLPK